MSLRELREIRGTSLKVQGSWGIACLGMSYLR